MTSARRLHYDYAEYLHTLEVSRIKLEYCDGVYEGLTLDPA